MPCTNPMLTRFSKASTFNVLNVPYHWQERKNQLTHLNICFFKDLSFPYTVNLDTLNNKLTNKIHDCMHIYGRIFMRLTSAFCLQHWHQLPCQPAVYRYRCHHDERHKTVVFCPPETSAAFMQACKCAHAHTHTNTQHIHVHAHTHTHTHTHTHHSI